MTPQQTETTSNQDLEPLEQEEDFIGEEAHLVPKVPPGMDPERGYETCNGKQTETEEEEGRGNITRFTGYCDARTGAGTEGNEGRCKWHGGQSTGPPAHSQNAAKTYANVDPHHFAQSLPEEQKEFLEGVSDTIEERLRSKKGDIDYLDRILARRVAVELHIVAKESDYVENVSGLLQTIQHEHGSHKDEAPLLQDIRQRDKDIIGMLKSLGVLEDPESQKADALDQWREFVDQGEDESEIIDVESSAE